MSTANHQSNPTAFLERIPQQDRLTVLSLILKGCGLGEWATEEATGIEKEAPLDGDGASKKEQMNETTIHFSVTV